MSSNISKNAECPFIQNLIYPFSIYIKINKIQVNLIFQRASIRDTRLLLKLIYEILKSGFSKCNNFEKKFLIQKIIILKKSSQQ
ncbi:hypothetical protein pb186bvf_014600 [Paramecium bursaria]